MKSKLKTILIFSFFAILLGINFVELIEISDKQKYLQKLIKQERELDEEIELKKETLDQVSSSDWLITQARKKGLGFKNDKRFEEK